MNLSKSFLANRDNFCPYEQALRQPQKRKKAKPSLSEHNLYINDKFVEAKMFEMHVEFNMPKMSRHLALYRQIFQQNFN